MGEITVLLADGTPAPDEHKDYVLQPFINRSNLAREEYAYLQEDLKSGAENLRNYLRSQGYWDASIVVSPQTINSSSNRIDVSLREEPGTLYTLTTPILNVTGAPIPEKLKSKITELLGQTATSKNINILRATVEDSFKRLGFQYLNLYMQQKDENGKTQLIFTIDTGNRFQLNSVSAEGDDLTRNDRITNRFKDLLGEDFDRETVDLRIRKLLGTGAFTSIDATESPLTGDRIDLILEVTEAKPYGVSTYAGVGSLEGPILGLGFFNRNLFGELWNFNVGAEVSGLGVLGEVSLTNPFFLERNDLSFTPRASLTTRQYDGYNKFEGSIGAEVDWQVNNYYKIRGGLAVSYTETSPEDQIDPAELGIQDYVTNRLFLHQTYDRRNDPAIPTDGYIANLETELGLAVGDDSISYISNKLRFSYYRKLNDKSHIALGGRLGSIIPLGEDEDLPIDLRVFQGGANSIRSFQERELGPTTARRIPRGGQSYFVANAEYVREIIGPVNGVVFFDAAGVARDSFSFGLDDPRYAAGLGIRLHLPIGPVRFEYGRSLNQQDEEDSGAFHFSIGTSF